MRVFRNRRHRHPDRTGAGPGGIERLEQRVMLAVVYPGPTTLVGGAPTGVVVADFNGDGIPDAATANFDSNSVTVLLGQGDGSFEHAVTLETLGPASRIVAGDLNGDGIADLVVSEHLNNTIAVFLGNGDGTFGDPERSASTGGPVGLALADLNGNGDLDLVVTNFLLNLIRIYPGNGDGTFGAPTIMPGGLSPRAVEIGDLTGDGVPDLVVAASGDNAIRVYVGNGDGTFGAPVQYEALSNPTDLALGNINGDGFLDILVASSETGIVHVFLNDGTGALWTTGSVQAPVEEPRSIALADLDGDGVLDYVVAGVGSGNVRAGLGDGSGAFALQPAALVGDHPRSVTVADMNGDGIPDVVVVNEFSGTLTVLFGIGNGRFDGRIESPAGANVAAGMAAGDFDGNGQNDLAVALPVEGTVQILRGNFAGTFTLGQVIPIGGAPVHLATGDLNGNGHLDLVVSLREDNAVVVYFNDGTGLFQPGGTHAVAAGPEEVRLGDMNGNGHLDIVVAATTASAIDILLNDGSGSFGAATSHAVPGNPLSIRLGDLDGDDDLDIAMVTSQGGASLQWLRNNGDATFTGPSIAADLGGLGRRLALGDLDGDGDLDAVATTDDGRLVIWRNNGFGVFVPGGSVAIGSGLGAVELADVNVNGRPDAVVAASDSDRVVILEGDGALGFFPLHVAHTVASTPAGLAVGYFGPTSYRSVAVASGSAGVVGLLISNREPLTANNLRASATTVTRDQLVTFTIDVFGNQESVRRAAFWADFNGNGVVDPGEFLGQDEDGSDGWSITVALGEFAPLGPGLTIIAIADDFAGISTDELRMDLNVIFSTRAAGDATVSGVADGENRYYVGARNPFGRPVLYTQATPGGAAWNVRDLQAATGSPELTGDTEFFVDQKDGLLYAIASSEAGLLLFVQRDGIWTFRNLSVETGLAAILTGQTTVFADTFGVMHVGAITDTGDLLLFFQTGAANEAGDFVWSVANLTTEHLAPQGMSTPAFVGRITSYTTSWNARNIVGVDADGNLHTLWIADEPGFVLWRTDDLTAITGSPAILGGLTIYLTTWDGINIAGTDADGQVSVSWWVPEFGGDWQVSNLTDLFSGPRLAPGALTSYVTPWGGLNVAGIGPAGDLVIYWWVPQFGGEWVVSSFDEVLPGGSPRPDGGGLSGFAAADGRLNVFGRNTDNEIIRYGWNPDTDTWTPENLTAVAVRI